MSVKRYPAEYETAGFPPYPFRDGFLPALCWCGRSTLYVPVCEVRRGRTGCCGYVSCHAPVSANERETKE